MGPAASGGGRRYPSLGRRLDMIGHTGVSRAQSLGSSGLVSLASSLGPTQTPTPALPHPCTCAPQMTPVIKGMAAKHKSVKVYVYDITTGGKVPPPTVPETAAAVVGTLHAAAVGNRVRRWGVGQHAVGVGGWVH